jgi:hypothetical protein
VTPVGGLAREAGNGLPSISYRAPFQRIAPVPGRLGPTSPVSPTEASVLRPARPAVSVLGRAFCQVAPSDGNLNRRYVRR